MNTEGISQNSKFDKALFGNSIYDNVCWERSEKRIFMSCGGSF